MEKIRIAFFDTKPYDRRSFDDIRERYCVSIDYYETRLTPESALMASGADAVCAFVNDDLSARTLEKLVSSGVKLIAMRCAGYNNVDLAYACDKLEVVRVPEYSPYAVAEYTLGLILCLNRKYHRAFARVRENNFSINGFTGFDLHSKTVGIIGTGRIGRAFARVLQGFGVRILAYDVYPAMDAARELCMEYVPLEELYAESDIISLHCPLTPENVHLINPASIALMKPGVMIINTSRGKLIDTAALIDGLKSLRVGSAGLDVYEEETDYFFEDCSESAINDDILARLMTFPNVLVTSHQAFLTREALNNIASSTLENIRLFFDESSVPNGVCENCRKPKCPRCKKYGK